MTVRPMPRTRFAHFFKYGILACASALVALSISCGPADSETTGDGDGDLLTGGTSAGGSSFGTGGGAVGGTYQNTGGDSAAGGSSAGGSSSGGAGTGGGGGDPVECPSSVLPPGDTTRTIMVGGKTRSYILHVPGAYQGSSPVPLIVDFHPLGGSGAGQRSDSTYPAQVDSEGVIMAFPSGESGPAGGAWNVGPCCVAGVDDVEFARALVADIQSDACIDPKRIYAAGFSMGGGMSHYLACHAADLFAAVAPAAFDLLEENVTTCNPSRPIPIVAFRGTNDFVVEYEGGDSAVVPGMPVKFLGAEDTQDAWADKNECTGMAASIGDGCTQYSNCDGGVSVTLCTEVGGGHAQGKASIAWPILKTFTLP